jgi:hypothetical protein
MKAIQEKYNGRRFKMRIINSLSLILFLYMVIISDSINAQESYTISQTDSLALENVIVEKYYVYTPDDHTDTTLDALPAGSVTYRIFIDMLPDYSLQVVYGDEKHELFFKTTTTFFNDTECYALTGFNIDAKKLHIGNVVLDSWITMGAASRVHTGVLRSEDEYGGFSFIPQFDSLSKADGLTKGVLPNFKLFNLDLSFFRTNNDLNSFSTNNGAWAALGGVKGPTTENRVLIAQLTTDGEFSFGLNVQIGTPTGGYIQFVAKNPEGTEIQFKGLTNN